MVSRAVRCRILLIAPSPSTTIRFSISCPLRGIAVKAIQTLRLPARNRIPYIMADCRLGYKLSVASGVLAPRRHFTLAPDQPEDNTTRYEFFFGFRQTEKLDL